MSEADLVLALHALHVYLQVQLAHAADDGLPSVPINADLLRDCISLLRGFQAFLAATGSHTCRHLTVLLAGMRYSASRVVHMSTSIYRKVDVAVFATMSALTLPRPMLAGGERYICAQVFSPRVVGSSP